MSRFMSASLPAPVTEAIVSGSEWMLLALVALLVLGALAITGLLLLARIARGIGDLRERMDDLKVRLGVLDPGDTRVNPFSQAYLSQTKAGAPPDAPDETLPGNG
jgi:Sec-independent protein translocase protein TatA